MKFSTAQQCLVALCRCNGISSHTSSAYELLHDSAAAIFRWWSCTRVLCLGKRHCCHTQPIQQHILAEKTTLTQTTLRGDSECFPCSGASDIQLGLSELGSSADRVSKGVRGQDVKHLNTSLSTSFCSVLFPVHQEMAEARLRSARGRVRWRGRAIQITGDPMSVSGGQVFGLSQTWLTCCRRPALNPTATS